MNQEIKVDVAAAKRLAAEWKLEEVLTLARQKVEPTQSSGSVRSFRRLGQRLGQSRNTLVCTVA